MLYKIKIRRHGKFKGKVRPNAEQCDGKVYNFEQGWTIEKFDHGLYYGEVAMLPRDKNYPQDAPAWQASGDLTSII